METETIHIPLIKIVGMISKITLNNRNVIRHKQKYLGNFSLE